MSLRRRCNVKHVMAMSLPYICDSHQDMLQSHKYLIRNVTRASVQTKANVFPRILQFPHITVCNLHQNSSKVSPVHPVNSVQWLDAFYWSAPDNTHMPSVCLMVNKRPESLLPSVSRSEGWAAPSWEELVRRGLFNTNKGPYAAEVQQTTTCSTCFSSCSYITILICTSVYHLHQHISSLICLNSGSWRE